MKGITSYYAGTEDPEVAVILDYLVSNGITPFPYNWANEYSPENKKKMRGIDVRTDEQLNLPYVLLDEKRLYYPRTWSEDRIILGFFGEQMVAQHPHSPHRYIADDFIVDENSIIVDCGVAEGNFGLSVVDKCKKLYLFEPEELWVEPLRATFAPWKDKVVIVQKYLSDKTDDQNVALDDFFTGKEYPNFLKLDVEGYEERVLLGANTILSSDHLKKVVTCTYHKAEDEEVLGTLLRNHGFTTKPSEGYMIFLWDQNELNPPYLRRGVLRATKHL